MRVRADIGATAAAMGAAFASRAAGARAPQLSPRIVGGVDARIEDFPFFAALGFPSGNSIFVSCGGALLGNTTVVTAAHCVFETDQPEFILFGSDDISSSSNGRQIAINDIVTHPDYNPRSLENDIAVIHLAEAVTDIEPIKLPQPGSVPETNSGLTAVGFGLVQSAGLRPSRNENPNDPKFFSCSKCNIPCQDDFRFCRWGTGGCNEEDINTIIPAACFADPIIQDKLKTVELQTTSFSACQEAYLTNEIGTLFEESMFCAGAPSKDTCQGDSGGPILQNGDTLVGIVSFGFECAAGIPNLDGVYTRVGNYIDFLEDQRDGGGVSVGVTVGIVVLGLAFLVGGFVLYRFMNRPVAPPKPANLPVAQPLPQA